MKNEIKTKSSSSRIRKEELCNKVLDFLGRRKSQSFNYKQIAYGIVLTSNLWPQAGS